MLQAMVPQLPEHAGGNLEQPLGRLDRLQQRLKLRFQLIATYRLPVAWTSSLAAEVVRIACMRARRPGSGQRRVAVAAENEPTQRKIFVEVAALRQPVHAVETVLNLLVGLEGDQPLVLARTQTYAPFRRFDISGIDGLLEHDGYALIGHAACRRFGEEGALFEEAHDIRLRLEAARGIAFERFDDDGRHRLIAFEHLAAPRNALIAIPHGSLKDVIAILQARPHPVLGLLAVLLPLVLRDRCQKVFDHD
nr:hypothetical protein [Jiella mangrovi]